MTNVDDSRERVPIITQQAHTGKWWVIQRDGGATEPLGPFDSREQAAARLPSPPAAPDMGCKGCGEPVYLMKGFGYSHRDTTLNVGCDARPKPTHPSVPKIPAAPEGVQEMSQGTSNLYIPKAQYEAMKMRLETRVAELESNLSALPVAEPKWIDGDEFKVNPNDFLHPDPDGWQSCALGIPYPRFKGAWPPHVKVRLVDRTEDIATLYGCHWITRGGRAVQVTHWKPLAPPTERASTHE